MKDIGIPFKVTVGSKITGLPALQVKVIITNIQKTCNQNLEICEKLMNH